MSKGYVFELNEDGVGELLKSPAMHNVLKKIASAKVRSLGSGYGMRDTETSQRAVVSISTETAAARKDNAEHNTLRKALG